MPIEDNELIVVGKVEVGVIHHHVLVEIEKIDHSNVEEIDHSNVEDIDHLIVEEIDHLIVEETDHLIEENLEIVEKELILFTFNSF